MDREALFTEYYKKNYRIVLGYIYKKTGNMQTAEDMTMEVFAKCFERFADFDENRASFSTWLFVIVNNRLKNYYRDRREFEELDEAMAVYEGFEEDIVRAEYLSGMRAVLYEALKSLNKTQRKIVILKYFKEKNSTEIAAALNLTPVNVRVQLSRAMTIIRDYFKKNNIETEL